MDVSDFVYTMASLIILLFLMMGPLLIKLIKGVENKTTEGKRPPKKRLQENSHQLSSKTENWDEVESQFEILPSERDGFRENQREVRISPVREQIEKMPPLKRAVIWSEILSKPLGLKEWE